MKKSRIMIITAIGIAVILVLVYYFFLRRKEAPLMQALPANVLGFVRINQLDAFRKTSDSDLWNELEGMQLVGELSRDLELFSAICNTDHDLAVDLTLEQLIAGACITKSKEADYLFLLDLNEASKLNIARLAPMANQEAPKVGEHIFEKERIYEFSYANTNLRFTMAKVGGICIFSTSTVLVENAVLQLHTAGSVENDKGFSRVDVRDERDEGYAVFIHMRQLAEYLSMFADNANFNQVMQLGNYASWLKIYPAITDDGIAIQGYASSEDDEQIMALDQYSGDFDMSVTSVMPAGIAVLWQVNTERLSETIAARLQNDKDDLAFFDHWAPWMGEHLSIGMTEAFDKNYQKKYITILPATDTILALNKLQPLMIADSVQYRGHQVMELNSGDVLTGITGCAYDAVNYAVLIRNHFLFTNELQQLKNVIDAIESGQTMRMDKTYAAMNEHLPASFNSAAYIHFQRAEEIIKSFLPEENVSVYDSIRKVTEKFPQLEIRFSKAGDDYMVHGFLDYRKNQETRSGRIWQTQLEYDIAAGPFTVSNAATGQKNILVQDTANQVYLLSPGGVLVWKTPVEGNIMGGVHSVDFYGNNKSQILFNTPAGIFLYDMSGEAVEGFPIRLTSPATNPLSVIYGEHGDYNMYIACQNNNVYGFSKKGKPLPNWNPMKNAGGSKHVFTPVGAGKNNFLVIQTENALVVVDQNGKRVRSIPASEIVSPVLPGVDNTFSFVSGTGFLNTFSIDGTQKRSALISATITSAGFTDVNDDGKTDLVYLDATGFGAKTFADTTLFHYRIDMPETYFTVAGEQDGQDYFGVVSPSFNRTILFNADGSVADGFPVDGAYLFVVDMLQRKNSRILLTGSQNIVSAYRVQ